MKNKMKNTDEKFISKYMKMQLMKNFYFAQC